MNFSANHRLRRGVLLLLSISFINLSAQILPVTIEAESGTLGADFNVVNMAGTDGISITTDLINSLNPGSADRVASYEVTFPAAGSYDLFARVYVGAGTFNDDSQFIPNGLGSKDPASDADWFRVNGLAAAGYTLLSELVDGGGTAGSGVWKWINLTKFAEGDVNKSYIVEEGSLTRTFQLGAREDGLYIDKLVFGETGLYYTVGNLMNEEAGSDTPPVPGTPLAEGQDKFLGCGWDYIQAVDFPSYWNQSTPGNAGKWGSVEGTRDVMNWGVLDSTYNEARRYKMIFKEHTLIWGAQQPNWMNDLDSAQQRQEIEEWFAALANRYDSIELIDVVNEPIHNAPNGMLPWGADQPNIDYAGALGGEGDSGWEWIIESFRLARQYFPDSKLILNEYSVINSSSTTQTMIEIVNLLKAEDLIDGIGEQAHAFTTKNTSSQVMKNNLDALAATGVPLYITEFDIDGPTDLEQLQEMQRVFPLFWEHPAMAGVTLWGYRYGLWRTEQGAYLFNEDGSERVAMTWLKAYVNDTLQAVESINITSATGENLIETKGGSLQLNAEVLPLNATIDNITWSVQQNELASIDQNGLLTALDDGTVTVNATAWDGSGIKGSLQISISNQNVLVEAINISTQSGDTLIDVNGGSLQMLAEVLPSNAANIDFSWGVEPAGLATIDQNGLLVALDNGIVTVTATASDDSGVQGSQEISISNQDILVETITLTTESGNLLINEKGASLQVLVEILPVNATDPSYNWSLEPDSLASISETGLLSALADGNLTVIASAIDGSGVTGELDITITGQSVSVEDALAASISIFPNPSENGSFSIKGAAAMSEVTIMDMSGKKVNAFIEYGSEQILVNADLEDGLYILEISQGQSRSYHKLVVKK